VDKCKFPGCKNDSVLIYVKKDLCWKCWEKYAEKTDVLRKKLGLPPHIDVAPTKLEEATKKPKSTKKQTKTTKKAKKAKRAEKVDLDNFSIDSSFDLENL
jgi:hypothetical protein